MAADEVQQPVIEPAAVMLPGGVPVPPGEDELPCDDGVPMETSRHREQMMLLLSTLREHWADRDDFFVGGNMFFYFSMRQLKGEEFRGPDVMVALDVPKRERKSWVSWQEGKYPDVIIELVSETTEQVDRVEKKRVYGEQLRIPEYFIYDPFSGRLDGFRYHPTGAPYRPIAPNAAGRLPSARLQLELGVWEGRHADIEAPWLRWFTPAGETLPTAEESSGLAKASADRAKAEADRAKAEAEQLAERLAAYEARFGPLGEGSDAR